IVVLSVLTVGVGSAGAVTTFTYANDSQYPTSTTTAEAGQTYQHETAVETNASNGPIEFVVFFNKSAVSYQSHTATLGGSTTSMQTTTSTVTVNGQQFTRVRFVNRSPSVSGTKTLRLTANLSMPDRRTVTTIYTGGAHGPSGTTLPRRETTVTVDRSDLTVTEVNLNLSSPSVDDQVTVSSTIANEGPVTASSQTVQLLVDGNEIGKNTTSVTGSGDTTVSFEWSPETSGRRNVT
ncbi:hypothetical protein DJ68_04720, partial [Halorubrum sp. C3]